MSVNLRSVKSLFIAPSNIAGKSLTAVDISVLAIYGLSADGTISPVTITNPDGTTADFKPDQMFNVGDFVYVHQLNSTIGLFGLLIDKAGTVYDVSKIGFSKNSWASTKFIYAEDGNTVYRLSTTDLTATCRFPR